MGIETSSHSSSSTFCVITKENLSADSGCHNDLIIDQFTKQAIPFTQNVAHSAEYEIKRLVTLSNVSKNDTVLDVACGSGLVSCESSRIVHRVTGIYITPAMIE